MENRITGAHFQIVYPNSQAYTSDRIVGIGIQVNSWTLPWIPRLDRNYSLENYRNLSRNKSHFPDYGRPWSILFVCLFICVCMCAWMHTMSHVWRSQNKLELVLSFHLVGLGNILRPRGFMARSYPLSHLWGPDCSLWASGTLRVPDFTIKVTVFFLVFHLSILFSLFI